MLYRKVAAALIIIYHSVACLGQDATSPELTRMHANAREQMARGNYEEAITIYKQLTAICKTNYNLLAELSQAYAKNGEVEQATEPFGKVGPMPEMTDTTYCILSQIYLDAHQQRNANKWANWGLKQYPNSGILYEQHGSVLYNGSKTSGLAEWVAGMEKAPAYAGNYKRAAMAAATSGNIWPMIWGETYLCMPHDTTGDAELKMNILQCWKNYLDHLPDTYSSGTAFEKSTAEAFLQLTPVISDGVTTESLTMIKTRFMLQLSTEKLHDIPLWPYYDLMLKEGWFDTYNEWAFGAAENNVQHQAWMKFHTGDIEQFLKWAEQHPLHPTFTTARYEPVNTKPEDRWFKKKKR